MAILHILIAFTSIVLATCALFLASRRLLNWSRAMSALTLASGVWLVVMAPAHMLTACLEGVAYVTVVMALGVVAQQRITLAETGDADA